jgi:hypothetical protein
MSKYRNLIIVLGLALVVGIIFGCNGRVVITDGESPVVIITFPANGATVSGDTVFVSATATDNKGVNRVEFWVDGIKSFTDNSSPYSFPWLILVFNDSTDHIVQAIAYDASGNVDTASISATVRVTPGFQFISSLATVGVAYNLFVWGDYVAVAAQANGVEIYNIANPASPTYVSTYSAGSGLANGVFVAGSYMFIAYGQEGLHVVDISNPAFPVYKSSLILPGFADVENVFVSAGYAYLAAKNLGMFVVDLSNLDTLAQRGQYNLSGGIAYDVKVVDTLAYIAYGSGGMEIVNVIDPDTATFVGNFTPAGFGVVRRLDIVGNRAYLALQNSGLEIVNITNPAAPVQLGNYNNINVYITGADLDGTTAYAANRDDGVQIVDVTTPAAPVAGLFYNTEGQANNLVFRNSFVFVADQTFLTILRHIP